MLGGSVVSRIWLWCGLLVALVLGLTVAIFVITLSQHDFVEAANVSGPWLACTIALVIAILTAMYVAATQDMARATIVLAEETKKTREQLSAPAVLPFFTFERRLLMVNVENIGAGLARDVTVKFQPPIPSRQGPVDQLPVNQKPIPVLRPRERFPHFVDVAPSFFSKSAPKPKDYVATVSYTAPDGKPVQTEYPLDLSVYEGMLIADENGIPELVKHVERIMQRFEGITELHSLRIKTPEDIRSESAKRRKEWAEQERQERSGGRAPLGLGRVSSWLRRYW